MPRPLLTCAAAMAVAIAVASCADPAHEQAIAFGATGAGGGATSTSGTGGTGGSGGGGGSSGGSTGGSPACGGGGASVVEPCATDDDCGGLPTPCPACPNGARLCASLTCQGGVCVPDFATCPDPCAGDVCGAFCSVTCDWTGCTQGVCDGKGQCVAEPGPPCGPPCMQDTDCAQPGGPCVTCPGGTTACEQMVCSFGACQPAAPSCPAVSCAGQPCGAACIDASQQPGQCDGVDTCVVPPPPPWQPGFCAAGCRTPNDCPGGFGAWTSWDGCGGDDLARCVDGQCGLDPAHCTPQPPCEADAAGEPCLPLCAELGCPTPKTLPSAHCDASGACVVDPPSGSCACTKNADCPTFQSPWFGPCPSPWGCLAPICVAGACATFVAEAQQMSCAPMDAQAAPPTCTSQLQGFAWDGTACVPLLLCGCAGMDCDALLPSLAVCEALHEGC